MRQKSGYIVGAIGIICLVLSFSNLSLKPVQAQWGQPGSSFPRQRDIWEYTAMTTQTWDPVLYGHTFTVQADRFGRLPVVTAFHVFATQLYRIESDGSKTRVGGGNFLGYDSSFEVESPFHQSPGIILRPGMYLVKESYGFARGVEINSFDEKTQATLLSGYWSNP